MLAAIAATVVAAGSSACLESGEHETVPAARVQAAGTTLTRDGAPWWPVGLNAYQLATDWSINSGCGAEVDLDRFFGALPAGSLIRFNAFESFARSRVGGGVDYRPIDAVFDAAERHGQLLIPVLTAFDGSCADEVYKDREWFVSGWREPEPGTDFSYEGWVNAAVDRWKGSPTIAMWELIGEPEPLVGEQCPPDAGEVLRRFVDDVGAIVRGIDPAHPITVGTVGAGQCGTAGEEFADLLRSPYVDVAQYHDYEADGVPLPGSGADGLEARLRQSRDVGKPLLVAEIGQNAAASGACATPSARFADVRRKIDGQREAGTAGALFWAFVPDPRIDECTFDIGIDDPLISLVGAPRS
ncbi:hypothetical protein Rrhod_1858 [Rhodococcus rhodnii LMG 5362]|uniref:Glycoside hydrolase family 5 domain-containing protein n=1 Tax=Rhodococcus rhodnii LMG 5362 TaxID=1273125 RepID=R7WS21_9NOCA|nr:hypothetical protein Rrhod_1858 [Rhodococcus rhodnii LMG 5362]